jgi:hypothetical protein
MGHQNLSGSIIEVLESRAMFSGTAVLAGGTLTINGGTGFDAITVTPAQVVDNGTSTVAGGTTSVFLNLPLLKSAAGLTLTGSSTTGRPAAGGYQLGFPILPSSTFDYRIPFAAVSGTINHSGTVTFNNSVTVGNFSIGFDASRATNGRSGFFVASTTGVKAILFDLGTPSSVNATRSQLNIGRTPLLVSPEFASFLGKPALAGANVGAASTSAVAAAATVKTIGVNFAFGQQRFSFPSSQVHSVIINSGSSGDIITVSELGLDGGLDINLGTGSNQIALDQLAAGNLKISGGSGPETVSVTNSAIVSTQVALGQGFFDSFTANTAFFTGSRSISATSPFSTASAFNTDLTTDAFTNFGNVLID